MAKYLDQSGVQTLWNKVKSKFARVSQLGSNINFDNVIEGGMYRYDENVTNAPSGAGTFGQLLVVRGGADTIAQLCFPYAVSKMYLRTGNPVGNSAGTWQPWVELANSSQINWNNIIDKPAIPTVYNPTITLKQNGTTKGSFSLNQSYGTTINLDGGGTSNITSLNEAFDGGEIIDYDISSCQSWRIMLCHNNSDESIYITIAGKRMYIPEALPTIIEIFTNDSNITGVKISGFSTSNSSVVYALTVSNMETLTINTSGISSSTRFRITGIGI